MIVLIIPVDPRKVHKFNYNDQEGIAGKLGPEGLGGNCGARGNLGIAKKANATKVNNTNNFFI